MYAPFVAPVTRPAWHPTKGEPDAADTQKWPVNDIPSEENKKLFEVKVTALSA